MLMEEEEEEEGEICLPPRPPARVRFLLSPSQQREALKNLWPQRLPLPTPLNLLSRPRPPPPPIPSPPVLWSPSFLPPAL